MVTLEIEDCILENREDVSYVLRDIASLIDQGYYSGMAVFGICWSITGKEEGDEC